jgi:hypothetical protein
MDKTHAVAAIAFVTVLTGSALMWTTPPSAHADALADLRLAVNNARSSSTCAPLAYSTALEGEAQHYILNDLPGVPPAGQYVGTWNTLLNTGDPESTAIKNLITGGVSAAVTDCSWKDFGVGYFRDTANHEEFDRVAVSLGKPAASPAPPAPAAPNPASLPVHCSIGGYTLPPGSDCSKTPNPAPPPAPQPVVNAITASFGKPGLTSIQLIVTNSSALTGACHYDAEAQSLNPFVPSQTLRDFPVAPHTTTAKPHVETFDGAPTLTNYQVTITCTDASGQQKDPIGTVQLSQMW